MYRIEVSSILRSAVPHYMGAALAATVRNAPTHPDLQTEIARLCSDLTARYDTASIKSREGIRQTREAYRAIGKDPSRYRPACEQLCRRVLQGKGLYQIDTLVDLGNAVSLMSGYSTAMVDAAKLRGDTLTLGVGREDEPYEAIGRGALNIHLLPAFRDAEGAFATPTSDSVRTQISLTTTHVLLIINAYDGSASHLDEAVAYARRLMMDFACATDLREYRF